MTSLTLTITISVHVHDTDIMSASSERVLWLKCHLQKRIGVVDDGPTSYFLEIEVVGDMQGRFLELYQRKYITKILLTFNQYMPELLLEIEVVGDMHHTPQCIRRCFRKKNLEIL